jgi:hypothetical protein
MQKITPDVINARDLKKYDVFVFGSNLAGVHGAGAARFAADLGIAKYGQGTGLYMKQPDKIGSFAIPTKGMRIEVLPLDWINYFVDDLIDEINGKDELNFLVTPVGCGLAGFKVYQMAPMFQPLVGYDNVSLPQSFIDFYEGRPVILNGKLEEPAKTDAYGIGTDTDRHGNTVGF